MKFKKINKNKKAIIGLLLSLFVIVGVFTYTQSNEVKAADTLTVGEEISYPSWLGNWSTHYYYVNDEIAYCLEASKNSPSSSTNASTVIIENEALRKVLYYGYGGPGDISLNWVGGNTSEESNKLRYTYTHILASYAYSGDLYGSNSFDYLESIGVGLKSLWNEIQAMDLPTLDFNFNGSTNYTATNVYIDGNIQRTEDIIFNTGVGNEVTFSIPNGVTLVNITTNTEYTGTVTLTGGQTFYLKADLTYSGTLSTGELTGSAKTLFAPLIIKNSSSSVQDIGSYTYTQDPATIQLTATFTARVGNLELSKLNTNGDLIDGAVYTVTNIDTGESQDVTVTEGKIVVYDLLVGNYLVNEKSAPYGYLLNTATYSVTITANETSKIAITNEEPLGSVTVYKQDNETGQTAQGDATLDGAIYGLYAKEDNYNQEGTVKLNSKDELITQGTTLNRTITFNKVPLGEYYVKEISPSIGYELDTTIYDVSLTYQDQNTSIVTNSTTVYEQVKKGHIDLTKIITDGETGIQTLESNAEFQAILTSTGVIADTQTTDENGKLVFSNLPYGTYTIHQTVGADDTYICPDFQVTISENGQTFYYVLNNGEVDGYLLGLKYDEESLQLITASNSSFMILNVDTGEFVKQKIGNEYIDTFTTDSNGKFTTLLKLDAGNYRLIEVDAPTGYILDSTGVDFTISDTMPYFVDSDGDYWFTVNYYNQSAKGEIVINKTGETKDGGTIPLEGIIYDCYTAKDIIAPWDNETVLIEANTFVDSQTTDSNGQAIFSDLYLGDYYVVERETLPSYVLDTTKYNVSLTYQDQYTPIATQTLSLTNKLTETEISKTDITGENEIPGAYLKFVDENGETVDEFITTEEKTIIKGLEKGKTYTLIEEIAPDDYVISSEVTFTVNQDGTVTQVHMIDKQVAFMKQDFLTGDLIGGAHIIVVDKETGEIVDEFDTVENTIHYINGLIEGHTYYFTETFAPYGFELTETVEFTVSTEKTTEKVVMHDMPTLVNLNVIKTDSTTSLTILDNEFEFALYSDIDCTQEIGRLKSDTGNIVFENLRYSTYYLKETKAPTGYELSNEVYEIVIDGTYENGSTIDYRVANKPITQVKTGDTANIFLFVALTGMALIGVAYVVIKKKQKHDDDSSNIEEL